MTYYLRPTNNKINPKKLYGFDIETYGDKNKFLMGSIVGENEEYVFWDKKRMQSFILGNKKIRNSILFATNLGFDFLGLFGDDYNLMSKFHYIIKGSNFVMIKTITDKKQYCLKFYDTLSFMLASVDTLGKILNVPKLKKPDCIGKFVKMCTVDGKILEEYNIRDSRISFLFAKFLQSNFNDLGTNMKCTLASTSMSLFRNKYLKHWVEQPKLNILKMQYNAYYGGRVEAFYRGKIPENENYCLYDINSLYPFVMNTKNYPNPYTLKKGVDLEKEGITFCEIESPNILYPLLPFRTPEKLLFPVGKFKAWQSNVELRKAIELGYKIKAIDGYYYESVFNPFSLFISDLYKLRMNYKKNKSLVEIEIVPKILMNSLYGKFAQKLQYQELYFMDNQENKNLISKYCYINRELREQGKPLKYTIDSPDNRTIKKNGILFHEPRMFYVIDNEITNYPKFINPILSIYTTSYARLELYKWIELILKQGKKVLYCDTDSLITNAKLKTGEKLGEMKKEISIHKGIIIKPKFYYLEDESKKNIYAKSKGMHNLKTFLQFDDVLKTQKYEYVKFTKFREALRRKLAFNEKINVEKLIDLEDNKRVWKEKFNKEKLEKSEPIII